MQSLKLPAIAPDRQINFLFENNKLEGLSASERDKIILTLAQILMLAAGLSIEELQDDER